MRPLRTLNRFPSVLVIVDALARSMRGLASVLLILVLYLAMFTLLAVTLWSGLLSDRCLAALADNSAAAPSSFSADDLFLSVAFGGGRLVCSRPSADNGDNGGGGGGGACGTFDWIDSTTACPPVASAPWASSGTREGWSNATATTLAAGLCVGVGAPPSGGFESFDHLLAAFLTLSPPGLNH